MSVELAASRYRNFVVKRKEFLPIWEQCVESCFPTPDFPQAQLKVLIRWHALKDKPDFVYPGNFIKLFFEQAEIPVEQSVVFLQAMIAELTHRERTKIATAFCQMKYAHDASTLEDIFLNLYDFKLSLDQEVALRFQKAWEGLDDSPTLMIGPAILEENWASFANNYPNLFVEAVLQTTYYKTNKTNFEVKKRYLSLLLQVYNRLLHQGLYFFDLYAQFTGLHQIERVLKVHDHDIIPDPEGSPQT